MAALSGEWEAALAQEFHKDYYKKLYDAVVSEYSRYQIFPPSDKIFTAFELTKLSEVKVVIIGQDPYHGDNQAMGLSFSVPEKVAIPPSLVNIYKELESDLGCYIPNNGDLCKWARQGVLLLNSVLTVRAHAPASHSGLGWEEFTDAVVKVLNAQDRPIVFLLWGAPAARKAATLDNPRHLILKAPHPSPLSAYRGFFGCKHFSRTNSFLESNALSPIDWQIENI